MLDNDGKSFERKTSTHGMPVSEAGGSFEKSLANLGGSIDDPFMIFEDVKDLYKKILEEKSQNCLRVEKKKI